MKIVVGLGNPGRKYENTRHNVGFDVVQLLAKQFSGDSWKTRFEALTTEVQIGSERVLLLLPQTFMNLSGRSVKSALSFLKIPVSELLVISDDLNLDVGRLRLRASGSAGGQNGLKNIVEHLGTNEFSRLRVGIGKPLETENQVSFVLQSFAKAERELILDATYRSCSAIETWVKQGITEAMNQFNRSAANDAT